MANEIYHNFDEGNTLYAIVHKKTNDQVFDQADGGNTFEAWQDANVGNYDVAMTDHDGDYYSVDFPTVIITAGVYRVTIFNQVAGSPHADNDTSIAQGEIYWDGTAEIDTFTLDTTINDDVIGADSDTLETLSDELDALSAEDSKVLNLYGHGE